MLDAIDASVGQEDGVFAATEISQMQLQIETGARRKRGTNRVVAHG